MDEAATKAQEAAEAAATEHALEMQQALAAAEADATDKLAAKVILFATVLHSKSMKGNNRLYYSNTTALTLFQLTVIL